MEAIDHSPAPVLVEPDGLAPDTGVYEEVNPRGLPSGLRMLAWKNEQLPRSPGGHRWRLVVADADPKPDR